MQIPGEALLGKLWETLTDKAIGNLLRPWQIRREGRALLDLKRDELLVLAKAERDAVAIRNGFATLNGPLVGDHQILLPHVGRTPEASSAVEGSQSHIDRVEYSEVSRAVQADSLRREVNVAKAILHAETALEQEEPTQNTDSPSDDWIYRWRDFASSVSSEELQLLWGRVLAGEVKAPGAFSLRFLNFLHNLDKTDAQLIATAMPFVISDFVCRETKEHLERAGLKFGNLLKLQELGLLAGVEGLGLSKSYSPPPGQKIRVLIESHGIGVGFEALEDATSIDIQVYVVTGLGQQLARLGNFSADLPYLEAVGNFIKAKGFSVQIGRTLKQKDGTTQLLQVRSL